VSQRKSFIKQQTACLTVGFGKDFLTPNRFGKFFQMPEVKRGIR
jgi:hypothetical protein